MSIYNAIANHGRDVGAGLNAFAQGRYRVAQDQRANALEDENRAYVKSRNVLADQRYNQGQQRDLEAQADQHFKETLQLMAQAQDPAAVFQDRQRQAVSMNLPGAREATLEQAMGYMPKPVDPNAELKMWREKEDYKHGLGMERDAAKAEQKAAIPPKPRAPSDGMRKAEGFLGRMQSAEKRLADILGNDDWSPVSSGESFLANTNVTKTARRQRFDQAASDWIRSKLRRESGAVIGADEMDQEYETYFPVYGDSKEVIKQKRAARKDAENAMRIEAGKDPIQFEDEDASASGTLVRDPSGRVVGNAPIQIGGATVVFDGEG